MEQLLNMIKLDKRKDEVSMLKNEKGFLKKIFQIYLIKQLRNIYKMLISLSMNIY